MLLGSGISRSAGVSTGEEVTRELTARYARLHGADPGDCPIAWYRSQSGGEADYSALLEELAPTQTDRRNLLSHHFEPTDEDRDEGRKVPTRAHHAVASLIAEGYVKVVITTNFDRLLEVALSEAGVQANVVASPHDAATTTPIAHSPCTIIKVHGDYRSPDLKNTVTELDHYDKAIDRLLHEVFEQYGLIICGWSAQRDTALRAALRHCQNPRFATYWLRRSPPGPEAREVIDHRKAIEVQIIDADTVMDDLAEKVRALAEMTLQDPLTTDIAIAQLKRYVPDPVHRIRLHELVIGEAKRAIEQFQNLPMDQSDDHQQYAARIKIYEQAMERLVQILATGAFFSDSPEHDQQWARCVDRLATRNVERSGKEFLLNMQQYPTLLALYALGLGATASDRLTPLAHALGATTVRAGGMPLPVGAGCASWAVLDQSRLVPVGTRIVPWGSPVSEQLFNFFRPLVDDIIPDDERYAGLFDEVEYALGIAYAAEFAGSFIGGRAVARAYLGHPVPGALVTRHAQALIDSGVFRDIDHLREVCHHHDAQLQRWKR